MALLAVTVVGVLLLMAAPAMAQISGSGTATQHKVWHYSLSGYEVDIRFESDTSITWRDTKRGETDKAKTWHINDHTKLVGWYESDKTFVSLYSDFATGEAYCHVFRPNGAVLPKKGRLALQKE